jgi:hypothetical protein
MNRAETCTQLVNRWLTATVAADPSSWSTSPRWIAARDAITSWLDNAPSGHDGVVRMIGLVMLLSWRCAAALPASTRNKSTRNNFWYIDSGGVKIDETAVEMLAFRLTVARANGDGDGAQALLMGFLGCVAGTEVDVTAIINVLIDLFAEQTHIYLALHEGRL